MGARRDRLGRARRWLERTIYALLLALTALVAVPYGSVDPWWEGAFACAVFGLGALWMVEGALGRRWLVEAHRMLVPLVALTVFAFAQAVPWGRAEVAGVEVWQALSADPFETLRAAVKLSALVLALALYLRFASGERRLRALCCTLALVGAAAALFGILRQTTGGEAVRLVSPRLAANPDGYGQFFSRNHFAFFAEICLGAAAGLLLGARRERVAAYLALALPVWVGLVLSNSRGGLLGLCGLLTTAALLYLGRVRRRAGGEAVGGLAARSWRRVRDSVVLRAGLAAGLVALTLVGVVWLGGERLAERLGEVPRELGGEPAPARWGDRRAEIWSATLRLIGERPLAGSGIGAYRAAVTRHHDASGEMSLEQAHNDYLELAAGGGLIGVALFVWFLVLFLKRARERVGGPGRSRRALAAGALAGLAAVALHSLFDFGLHITANALFCVALCAVATADAPAEAEARVHDRRRPRRRTETAAVVQ